MRINMNADAEQEGGGGDFPIVEDGDYNLVIEEVQDGVTSDEAKNPGVQKVGLLIGICSDDWKERIGSFWHTVTFLDENKKGHGIWLHFNHAVGMPHDGAVDFDTDDYIGRKFQGTIGQKTYRKKDSNYLVEPLVQEGAGSEQPAAAAPAEDPEIPFEKAPKDPPAPPKPPAPPAGGSTADLEEVPF